jgi:hypothetical protein
VQLHSSWVTVLVFLHAQAEHMVELTNNAHHVMPPALHAKMGPLHPAPAVHQATYYQMLPLVFSHALLDNTKILKEHNVWTVHPSVKRAHQIQCAQFAQVG